MFLPLLASLSFAAEAPPLAEPAPAEALPTDPPARVLDPERLQDFERFHRRAQIAESALLLSYLGYVPAVLSLFARGSNADPMGPVGSAIVGVPALMGVAAFSLSFPVAAVSGYRAERALIDLGGHSRPGISKAALLTYASGAGLSVVAVGVVYRSVTLGDDPPEALLAATGFASVGLVLSSFALSVAQIEHLNRHHPLGRQSGTFIHNFWVGPFITDEQAGMWAKVRF